MGMTLKITASPKVIHVLAEGEFSLDEAKRTFLKVVDAVIDNDSERVLFDGHGIWGEPTLVERFYFGEFAAAAVRKRVDDEEIAVAPKFAFILIPPVLDPGRLGEMVAVNRGLNVKAFDDLSEGMAWLGLAPGDI